MLTVLHPPGAGAAVVEASSSSSSSSPQASSSQYPHRPWPGTCTPLGSTSTEHHSRPPASVNAVHLLNVRPRKMKGKTHGSGEEVPPRVDTVRQEDCARTPTCGKEHSWARRRRRGVMVVESAGIVSRDTTLHQMNKENCFGEHSSVASRAKLFYHVIFFFALPASLLNQILLFFLLTLPLDRSICFSLVPLPSRLYRSRNFPHPDEIGDFPTSTRRPSSSSSTKSYRKKNQCDQNRFLN